MRGSDLEICLCRTVHWLNRDSNRRRRQEEIRWILVPPDLS